MVNDPFTLTVAPDASGHAVGRLYIDPGDGFEYRKGEYAYRKYTYSAGTLTSSALHVSNTYVPSNVLERLEVLQLADRQVSSVTMTYDGESKPLEFLYASASGRLIIRAPMVPMAADWTITIQ